MPCTPKIIFSVKFPCNLKTPICSLQTHSSHTLELFTLPIIPVQTDNLIIQTARVINLKPINSLHDGPPTDRFNRGATSKTINFTTLSKCKSGMFLKPINCQSSVFPFQVSSSTRLPKSQSVSSYPRPMLLYLQINPGQYLDDMRECGEVYLHLAEKEMRWSISIK